MDVAGFDANLEARVELARLKEKTSAELDQMQAELEKTKNQLEEKQNELSQVRASMQHDAADIKAIRQVSEGRFSDYICDAYRLEKSLVDEKAAVAAREAAQIAEIGRVTAGNASLTAALSRSRENLKEV